MKFKFIEEHCGTFSTTHLCSVMGVSTRGFRAFRNRPTSRRQRTDMVVLANIHEQSRLSLGNYGRPRRPDSNHKFNIAPNHLARDFHADRPNQKWASDISDIWTQEGWLYLTVILDLHSRRVIGWAVSNRMKRDLAIRALQMAINLR